MKIKKNTSRRICIFLCVLLGAFIFTPMCFATGFTGVEEIDSIFNSFFSVLFGIIRVAGVVLLVFGIYQTFQSSQSHDTTARIQGVFMLGGGLVAFFLREILGFLGIAV